MALCNVFNAGCGFFFWIIAARFYSVEQVGLATALISSLGLVILFSRLGFDSSVIRFFSSEDRGKIISTSLIATTSACVLSGAIFILLAEMNIPFYAIPEGTKIRPSLPVYRISKLGGSNYRKRIRSR
jgi:O-antigen/teichoic acid export membrane protein